jgi:hypothetical protein
MRNETERETTMTAIMKITIASVVFLSLAGCARSVLPNRGYSFFPPISATQMERELDRAGRPDVILNGQSVYSNRQ